MTVWAVSGAAGYGKTFRLLQRLAEELRECPLAPGQAVLALTFMNGARQRLEHKLRGIPGLRYDCMTVDGFARSVRSRWKSLAAALGQQPTDAVDFDEQCALAAALAERPIVAKWVQSGYPLVIVDEGQDLDAKRLRLVQALAESGRLLVAFDEFQCLNAQLRNNPLCSWITTVCEPEVLVKPQRTAVPALLEASTAVRGGQTPLDGKGFKLYECVSSPMAAAVIASNIFHARNTRSLALITPSRLQGYADELVQMVSSKPCGTKKRGPYRIQWESGDSPFYESIKGLAWEGPKALPEIATLLSKLEPGTAVDALHNWTARLRDIAGRESCLHADLVAQARRIVSVHRARAHRQDRGRRALTVHQAKNREFDGVVVIWPYTVGQDDEGKRRLLYNAITRARLWCIVIVQGNQNARKPPFSRPL